jgi:uncharacterized phage protein (TIGR02220 family)
MPRARNIKPSFFTNEVLGTADPMVGLLFIGLWCLVDRDGITEDRPLRIKAELFPYRENLDINGYLTVLERTGHVIRYEVAEVRYIKVVNFEKHQHPHHTEKPKGYPQPPNESGKRVLTPLNNSYSPSDLLIPDLLIPDSKALSGKPDDLPSDHKKLNGSKAVAIELLEFLNAKTGKKYRPVLANLDPIAARIKEGFTPQDIRTVIVRKCREWMNDDQMSKYLRPATLFNRTKFAQYNGECVEE